MLSCAGVLTRRLLPLCLLYPLCDGFASGSAARARAIPAFALPHPPGDCEGFRVQGMRVSPRIQQQVGARPAGRRFALGERRRGRSGCVSGLSAAMIPEGSGGGGRGDQSASARSNRQCQMRRRQRSSGCLCTHLHASMPATLRSAADRPFCQQPRMHCLAHHHHRSHHVA